MRVEATESFTLDGKRVLSAVGEVPIRTRACFVNFGSNGVTYLRSQIPARELGAALWIRDGDLTPRLAVGDWNQPVVLYSMPREEFQQDEVAQLLDAGVKVIADVDDWLPGFIGKEDHMNASKYTEEYVRGHLDAVGACDLVTCSTRWIADRVEEELGVPALVVPNALSLDRWDGLWPANRVRGRAERRREERQTKHPGFREVIIGWSGSTGHFEAFKRIVPVLERVLRENDHVGFACIGEDLGALLAEDVQPSVVRMAYKPFPQHPEVLTQFHISVGPTLANDFYRAKSDLRALECWASGSVFCGGVDTYGDTIRHREDGFVHESPEELYAHLTLLVSDEALRLRVSSAGRDRLLRERLIEHTVPLWLEAIERVQSA